MNTIEYVLKRPDGCYLGYFGYTRRQLRANRTEYKGQAQDLAETLARVCGDKNLRVVAVRVRAPRLSLDQIRSELAAFSADEGGWWPLEVLLRDLARHGDRTACTRELLGIIERHPYFEGRGKHKSHPLFDRLEIPRSVEPHVFVESLQRAPSFRVMRMLFGHLSEAVGARETLKSIALTHPDERMRRRAAAWYEAEGGICAATGNRITVEEWNRRHSAEGID